MTGYEKDVGAKLRAFRKKNNLSLNDLARKTGIAASNLSSIELGKTSPTLGTLIRIAEAFDLRVGAFLDDVLYEKAYLCSHSARGFQEETSSTARIRQISPDIPQVTMHAKVIDVKNPSHKISVNHEEADRFLYCLHGEVSVLVDEDVFEIEAGDSVYVLPVASVEVHARGQADAQVLVIAGINRFHSTGT